MITIATSYKNRKQQLVRTLNTIVASSVKDIEMIVVDDASDEEHRLEDLVAQFPFLNIVRIEPHEKWYVNPCIAFNKAFALAKGDKIIIQNPECLHVGDVLQCVQDNLTDANYVSFAAFSLGQMSTERLDAFNYVAGDEAIIQPISAVKRAVVTEGDQAWYNHSKYRPVAYHFCSAITKSNLDKLGGFDERFAMGLCYDDDEFLARVHRAKLKIEIVDQPFVIHQWHYSTSVYKTTNSSELVASNKALFATVKNEVTLNPNDGWKFNVPKMMHVYWDKSPLSYLQLLTVKSFNRYNPTWGITIHVPKKRFTGSNPWKTTEQKIIYRGIDYTDQLLGLPYVTVQEVDFEQFGLSNDTPEVFKSDFLRWQLLGTIGGLWSDMDILYTKSINNISTDGCMIVGEGHKADTSLCMRNDALMYQQNVGVLVHIVGFHLACENNPLFKSIAGFAKTAINGHNYQSIGSHLLRAALPTHTTVQKFFPQLNIIDVPHEVVYPFNDRQIDQMFQMTNHNLITSRTIGVHWFNGSAMAKMYTNEFTTDWDKLHPCTITDLVKQFEQ